MIDEAIEQRYLVRPRTPMEETYREVIRQCRRRHLPVPSRNSCRFPFKTRLFALHDATSYCAKPRRLGSGRWFDCCSTAVKASPVAPPG
jgi:hypothetical protein